MTRVVQMGRSERTQKIPLPEDCAVIVSSNMDFTRSWRKQLSDIKRWYWAGFDGVVAQECKLVLWAHPFVRRHFKVMQRRLGTDTKGGEIILLRRESKGGTLVAMHKYWRRAYRRRDARIGWRDVAGWAVSCSWSGDPVFLMSFHGVPKRFWGRKVAESTEQQVNAMVRAHHAHSTIAAFTDANRLKQYDFADLKRDFGGDWNGEGIDLMYTNQPGRVVHERAFVARNRNDKHPEQYWIIR